MLITCILLVLCHCSLFMGETSSYVNVHQLPNADGNLHIYALPIGHGESNVIQCPDGTLAVWDMGNVTSNSSRFWSGPEIRSFLGDSIGRIKNIIITHQHDDHLRLLQFALPFQFELSDLQNIYINCNASNMATQMEDWVTAINGASKLRTFNNGNKCGPEGGSCGNIDICPNDPEVQLQILAANLGQHCSSGNINVDSIVGKLTYGDISILLPGDFEDETSDLNETGPLKLMTEFYGNELAVSVYHVARHGSSSLTNKPVWLKAVAPQMVWSSGDPHLSGYGMPKCQVLDVLLNYETLCKPGDTSTSPDYCGENIFEGLPTSQLIQNNYTCVTNATNTELRIDNDFAIYTTTPDESSLHVIDVATNGTHYGIVSLPVATVNG